jgi:hypothetical protein
MTSAIVGPDGNGGWKVTKPGNERASFTGDTQAEMIERAKTNLQNNGGGELIIQGRNGIIRDKDTIAPAVDPRDSKG